MLQQDKPEDFVLATNRTITIRKFATLAFNEIGIELKFEGSGEHEIATVAKLDSSKLPEGTEHVCVEGDVVIKIDKRYYRPTEVELLIGDSSKAKEMMGWEPKYTVEEMCIEMVNSDVKEVLKELHIKAGGYTINNYYE